MTAPRPPCERDLKLGEVKGSRRISVAQVIKVTLGGLRKRRKSRDTRTGRSEIRRGKD